MTRSFAVITLWGILISLTLGLGTWGISQAVLPYVAFTDTLPVHNGCASFYQRISPYDASVTAKTQDLIQARASGYDRTLDEHRFAYPLHLCVLLAPLWALPYDVAAPLWMFVNLALFTVLGFAYTWGVIGWKPRPLTLALLTLGVLLGWRYSGIVIILAQYVGFTLMALVGALWAFKAHKEAWLAFFLVLMTVRPESAVLAIPLLLWAGYGKRWRVWGIFAVWMAILWLIPTLWVGEWVLTFLGRISEYGSYNVTATRWIPLKLGSIGVPTFALFSVIGAWVAWGAWRSGVFLTWGMASLALFQLLAIPQTNGYTLVYALPSLLLMAYALRHRSGFIKALFGIGWVLAYAYVPLANALPNDQAFVPFGVMIALGACWYITPKITYPT